MILKKLTFILFSLFLLFPTGCAEKQPSYAVPSRIVTAIDIHCQKPSGNVFRHYEDPDKVAVILHYIRQLSPNGPTPVSPEAMQGPLYEIVVHLQDGGVRIHRQRSDSFAALHRRYWGRIDRSLGMCLPGIMALLPSD